MTKRLVECTYIEGDTHNSVELQYCRSKHSTQCVSQEELAAVKTEMERKVDQLHSQLHYWQNATVSVLNEHCSSL